MSALDFRDLEYLERAAKDTKHKLVRKDIAEGKLAKPTLAEVRMVRDGQKIQSIKAYRTRTGHGLLEAKLAVEACEHDWQYEE